MLTKILTAALGLIVVLMVLRFFVERAHRAQLRARSEARQRNEAAREPKHEAKPDMITLEVDPDTGVYRPKG